MSDLQLDILISRYSFLRSEEKLLVRDVAGSSQQLQELNVQDIAGIIGRKPQIRTWKKEKALKETENILKHLAEGRVKCLFLHEKEYPFLLSQLYNPPYVLYYRGASPGSICKCVGIVGTRLPSGGGIDTAFTLGFELGMKSVSAVSGLALGIDAAAHAGNIAAKVPSVAVLGCGPDRIYPSSNRKLAGRLLETGGCICSEYPPGTEPLKFHFPERNRIVSGLSDGVVVVEAPSKSGALITADFAIEQNRELFIHSSALKFGSERIMNYVFEGASVINHAGEIVESLYSAAERWDFGSKTPEYALNSVGTGLMLADRLRNELGGKEIRFNGKYFRRAGYESSYSTHS